jgi:hypothetical protein
VVSKVIERIKVKYKLDITIGDRHYDVGTLTSDPVITYLQGVLACLGLSTGVGCLPTGNVSVSSIALMTTTNQIVAQYPTSGSYGSISITGGSVGYGKFSLSMSATLNNPSLSGTYTVGYLYINVTLGSTTMSLIISNIGVSASNGQVMNISLSGSVSLTPSGVTAGLYADAFSEFWNEVLLSLGVKTGYSAIPWGTSGGIAIGYVIYVLDTNGNTIGSYSSSTASGTNVSNISISFQISGLSITITIQFVFTATANAQVQYLDFWVVLNTALIAPVPAPLLPFLGPINGYAYRLMMNIAQMTGSAYPVSAGSSYQIAMTDSVSVSSTT